MPNLDGIYVNPLFRLLLGSVLSECDRKALAVRPCQPVTVSVGHGFAEQLLRASHLTSCQGWECDRAGQSDYTEISGLSHELPKHS